MDNILKSGGVLAIISIIVVVTLSFTYIETKPIIESRSNYSQVKPGQIIVPIEKDELQKIKEHNKDTFKSLHKIIELYENEKLVGYIIEIDEIGYAGLVKVIVGLDIEGKVTNIEIGENQETPGLGTKIKEESFLNQFIGFMVNDRIAIVKGEKDKKEDIVAISGATISSEVVVRAVKTSLDAKKLIK